MISWFKKKEKEMDTGDKFREASMNFNMDILEPFLRKVASLIPEGFSEGEIERIMETTGNLDLDEEKELVFVIKFENTVSKLKVLIHMEETDSPDVYFFSPNKLAMMIRMEMERLCDELDAG